MRLAAIAVSLFFAASALGQTTQPTSRPADRQLTKEQQELIEKVRSQPPWEPAVKIDIRPMANGQPNEMFGKEDREFMISHRNFLKHKGKPVDLLFIGDSITSGWGGRGKKVWNQHYEKLNAANFGISGDKTQNVLWRIENGELDKIKPKVVVLMIGTNNGTASVEDMTRGVKAVVEQIHTKLPESKLLFLGIFPCRAKADDPARAKRKAVNTELAKLDDGKKTRYLEIWDPFLNEQGEITRDIMPDHLHPSEKGYQIWADAMQPLLDEMMK